MGKISRISDVSITERDLLLLQTLLAAGWLSTGQIRDQFFPGKSTNAVCKRLRKLIAGKYIGQVRYNSTDYALYRLASQGKLALSEYLGLEPEAITVPTQLPRKLKHFMAINDLRFSFAQLKGERGVQLVFFFSEHELYLYRHDRANSSSVITRLLKAHRIIPDALARIRLSDPKCIRDLDGRHAKMPIHVD